MFQIHHMLCRNLYAKAYVKKRVMYHANKNASHFKQVAKFLRPFRLAVLPKLWNSFPGNKNFLTAAPLIKQEVSKLDTAVLAFKKHPGRTQVDAIYVAFPDGHLKNGLDYFANRSQILFNIIKTSITRVA